MNTIHIAYALVAMVAIVAAGGAAVVALVRKASDIKSQISKLESGYEEAKRQQEQKIEQEIAASISSHRTREQEAKSAMVIAEKDLELVKREVEIYENDDRVFFAEHGLYKPHFDFGDSDSYKEEIKKIREEQRGLVKSGKALLTKKWEVDGCAKEGQRMSRLQGKLTLRAFNNECDVAIGKAKWDNVNAMEERIRNACEAIDKTNEIQGVEISPSYFEAKVKELWTTHEYRLKRKQEKEERAEIARQAREEKKLQDEVVKAAKEEEKYQKMLDKAKAEAREGSQKDKERIAELEKRCEDLHALTERAVSLAQITKRGHVYIVSNVGSFGSDVVKIGMTRRPDPDDRVKELGDASVPFPFDVHAVVTTDDAPALEKRLHERFSDRRVNLANFRKEYFRVPLDEVEKAIKELAPDAQFTTEVEAQEYRETKAMRKEGHNG